jgi:Mg2+ and Co2+ transporter CorA
LRRQANSVVRLTVVTFFGLIGTVATGFLGMNLIDLTQVSLLHKLLYLLAVLIPTAFLTLYTAAKAKRLADFLETVSDERKPTGHKVRAFFDIWRR